MDAAARQVLQRVEAVETAAALADLGVTHPFVQDNMSLSRGVGTLRGLHFQSPPHAQAKLVSVLQGRIYDVAVDVRTGSPTYGQHVGAELDGAEGWQIYVPAGFLHGFVTREADTIVQYKVNDVYAPDCDGAVLWNDPDLAIDWGISNPIVSEKDQELMPLRAVFPQQAV